MRHLMLLIVTGCTSVDPEALIETGDYTPGFVEWDVTYASAIDGEDRELDAYIWYPSTAEGDAAIYEVAGIVEQPSELALDAPPIAEGGPFPVAVYSHGSGGEAVAAYAFAEHLASWGWVVVAPNHRGNTTRDAFEGTATPFVASTVNRPLDLIATLDALESDAPSELADQFDASQVLVYGHSFGGYTAYRVAGMAHDDPTLGLDCTDVEGDDNCDLLALSSVQDAMADTPLDPRVAAIVPQAPATTRLDFAGSAPAVPMMLQSGQGDITTTHETHMVPAWEGTSGAEDIWLDMPDAGHLTFLSTCDDIDPDLLALFQPSADDDGCGDDFWPVSEAIPVLSAYLLAFGELHVRGDAAYTDVVYGESLAPEIRVETR